MTKPTQTLYALGAFSVLTFLLWDRSTPFRLLARLRAAYYRMAVMAYDAWRKVRRARH
jgi:hypothetical protein